MALWPEFLPKEQCINTEDKYIQFSKGTTWILSGIGWRKGNAYFLRGFLQDRHIATCFGRLMWKVSNSLGSFSEYACKRGYGKLSSYGNHLHFSGYIRWSQKAHLRK